MVPAWTWGALVLPQAVLPWPCAYCRPRGIQMSQPISRGLSANRIFPGMTPLNERTDAPQMRIEVRENAHAYTLHAEMPGVLKEDI